MFDSKVKSTKGFKFKLEIQIKRKEQSNRLRMGRITAMRPSYSNRAAHSSTPARPLLSHSRYTLSGGACTVGHHSACLGFLPIAAPRPHGAVAVPGSSSSPDWAGAHWPPRTSHGTGSLARATAAEARGPQLSALSPQPNPSRAAQPPFLLR